MTLSTLRTMLLWCTLINFGVLLLWFLFLLLPHNWLYRKWGRWFHVSAEQIDVICFSGMLIYKVLILLFNAVPYLALLLIGG